MKPSKLNQDYTMAKLKSALDETDAVLEIIHSIKLLAEDIKKIATDKQVVERINNIIETCRKANDTTNH
jgi:hypothetical protein